MRRQTRRVSSPTACSACSPGPRYRWSRSPTSSPRCTGGTPGGSTTVCATTSSPQSPSVPCSRPSFSPPGRRGSVRPHPEEAKLSLSAWVCSAVLALVPIVLTAYHVSGGGGSHARYLFPILPIVAAAAALVTSRINQWLAVLGGRRVRDRADHASPRRGQPRRLLVVDGPARASPLTARSTVPGAERRYRGRRCGGAARGHWSASRGGRRPSTHRPFHDPA